jgi:hypothetical protein
VALLVLGLAVIAGGCSGQGSDSSTTSEVGSSRGSGSATTEAGTPGRLEADSQLVAQSDAQVEVWESPEEEAVSHMFSALTQPSGILTFTVLDEIGSGWLHVGLPSPPVGSTGYVKADSVSLNRHRYRIEVSRGAHTLKVFAGDVEALTVPVSIGPDAPPAETETYIKELLVPPDGTPYGGHVYGLAGWNSTEAQFGAGSGVVAIHAASPEVLGTDTPTGAIGTDRAVLTRLVDNIGLPLGTPVKITP